MQIDHTGPMTEQPKLSKKGSARLRVLFADGTHLPGDPFRESLQKLHFVELVGAVKTSAKALDLFFELRPDVAIVSIILPKLDGMEVLRCIKRAAPNCDVILLSHAPNAFLEQAASLLGATGLCSIHEDFAKLENLLRSCWQLRFCESSQGRPGPSLSSN